MCEALGTHLPIIESLEDSRALFEVTSAAWPELHVPYLWSALNDKKDEGLFVYAYDGTPGDPLVWATNEPNGLVYENCVAIIATGLIDVNCPLTRAALCTFREPKRFSFLGTCEEELRNIYFVAYQDRADALYFRGYGSYYISKENGTWTWTDVVQNRTVATMEASDPDFPMGRRWWLLQREVCAQEPGGRRRLLLTPCDYEDFTCDDGTCISHHSRCDLKYDCRDESDELDCELVAFPQEYQKHLSPRPPGAAFDNLRLILDIAIETIDIETFGMIMQLSYEMEVSWFDDRLKYLNIKPEKDLNKLPMKNVLQIWIPIVQFLNTIGIHHTIVDEEATMLVKQRTPPVRRDDGAPAEGAGDGRGGGRGEGRAGIENQLMRRLTFLSSLFRSLLSSHSFSLMLSSALSCALS